MYKKILLLFLFLISTNGNVTTLKAMESISGQTLDIIMFAISRDIERRHTFDQKPYFDTPITTEEYFALNNCEQRLIDDIRAAKKPIDVGDLDYISTARRSIARDIHNTKLKTFITGHLQPDPSELIPGLPINYETFDTQLDDAQKNIIRNIQRHGIYNLRKCTDDSLIKETQTIETFREKFPRLYPFIFDHVLLPQECVVCLRNENDIPICVDLRDPDTATLALHNPHLVGTDSFGSLFTGSFITLCCKKLLCWSCELECRRHGQTACPHCRAIEKYKLKPIKQYDDEMPAT